MPRSVARREGSPFTGLGPVFVKEFSDHLSSARMMVLMLFVIAFGALPGGAVAAEPAQRRRVPIRSSSCASSPRAASSVPISFTAALNFMIPLMAIGLGFDSVNSEFNRRTLSRVLSQPIYRDALLLGKFLGGLATLAVALVALWLIVLGAGLLLLGLPPRGVEVARGIGFLVVAIAYGGVWLAVSMLFSVIFRSTATSALCALGIWLFFFILWPLIVPVHRAGLRAADVAIGHRASIDETLAMIELPVALMRLSPDTLFGEAVLGPAQSRDAHAGPHAAEPDARRDHGRAAAARPEPAVDLAADHRSDRRHDRGVRRRLRRLPARGSQGLKDWTLPAALNNARWCDAVCLAHGRPGTFLPHMWVNAEPVPRFYPNAVTLAHDEAAVAEQRSTIDILLKSNLPGRWAVKDSFNTLDLSRRGFDVLFEAHWIRSAMPVGGTDRRTSSGSARREASDCRCRSTIRISPCSRTARLRRRGRRHALPHRGRGRPVQRRRRCRRCRRGVARRCTRWRPGLSRPAAGRLRIRRRAGGRRWRRLRDRRPASDLGQGSRD